MPSQLAMPSVASLPWKAHVTGWFHQPARSAGRSGATPVMVGGASSYLTAACPVAALPATSRQSPLTVPAAASGPEYVTEAQPAMPDVASLPWKVHLTE